MTARIIRAYHERTRHAPNQYARSLGYLDWNTQPDPFRRFEGAPLVRLDRPEPTAAPPYGALFSGTLPSAELTHASISQLLYDSLALSAWKSVGENRWSLRVNPSSGNLHPTEGYLVLPAVEGVDDAPGIYHYAPREHALEVLERLASTEWDALSDGLPPGTLLFGFTSILWREAWKYGERAYRYCQHDVGHAVAAVSLAAAALGWQARLLPTTDHDLAVLLGTHRQSGPEREHPDLLMAIQPGTTGDFDASTYTLDDGVLARLSGTPRTYAPNVLSAEHHAWPIIEEAAEATAIVDKPPAFAAWRRAVHDLPSGEEPPARRVIRQRRSAVAMDARTGLVRDAFYEMLLRTCPGAGQRPFDAFLWRPRIHLALFVHRVGDLDPGLYVLLRAADQLERWKSALPDGLDWTRPDGCPPSLELFRLRTGDARQVAAAVSCGQDIAGDGAFAVAMIAEFDDALDEHGACFYRHLHWEAGAIGQVLYLEAEAAGVRATGIGCFFDELTHEVVGLTGTGLATLYHFTVGGAVDDDRIEVGPPYPDPAISRATAST